MVLRTKRCQLANFTSGAAIKIVSLVPSQTELLFDLGLDEEVVGITKFCVHPQKWFRAKQRIGGTKTVNIEVVKALKPDLIIANKEENVKEQIEELEQYFQVWVSDINTLPDACEMIRTVGKLAGKRVPADKMADEIIEAFNQLEPLKPELRTAYFIWKEPYMVAGGDTFINDMMKRCGFENIYQHKNRYPEVTLVTGHSPSLHDCQLLLLSSEPYPFKIKHLQELQQQLPSCKILLVDGQMFSWYGSRLLRSPRYFVKLIQQIRG
jgi:ABC-type Fe3+-hydroxamate transport system substrate-binding protein